MLLYGPSPDPEQTREEVFDLGWLIASPRGEAGVPAGERLAGRGGGGTQTFAPPARGSQPAATQTAALYTKIDCSSNGNKFNSQLDSAGVYEPRAAHGDAGYACNLNYVVVNKYFGIV
ncbi:hypothetical protein O0L34_g11701 [Tuta absoluta]|nr:hypothetical protein O0L34_g11701 [Tuta absoluta]